MEICRSNSQLPISSNLNSSCCSCGISACIKILLQKYKVIKKDSKSEQALQIIGHVVAKSYANKRGQNMGVNNLWSQTLLNKK
jgi:hypothetical protein